MSADAARDLAPILQRTGALCAVTPPPVDPGERAELAEAAEDAGATILRFAAICRGESDSFGVCRDCGKVVGGHDPWGCNPLASLAWQTARLARVVHGRSRFYAREYSRRWLRRRGSV